MKTVSFFSIRNRFQNVAGISALDSWERGFFENTLNRRLKEAWEFSEWSQLKEIKETTLSDAMVVGSLVKCLSAHGTKTPPVTGLAIGDIVEITGKYSDGTLKWSWPKNSDGFIGEVRTVTQAWENSTDGTLKTAVVGESLTVVLINDDNGKKYSRADGSFIWSSHGQYRDYTQGINASDGVGGFDLANLLGAGGNDSWEYYAFPDLDILGIFNKNPYTNRDASSIDFKLLDGQVYLDTNYTQGGTIWMLTRKKYAEVYPGGDVPAIFEGFLVSAILADFYRADGQQNKAMYEDQQAEKSLLDQIDRSERQNLQDQISIITYNSPNTQRYVQL